MKNLPMKRLIHLFNSLLLASSILLILWCAPVTADSEVYDPLISINRSIYEFNEYFDRFFLKPLAKGYQKLPRPIQTGTHNFFSNLNDVVVVANDLMQLKGDQFGSDILRLSVNSIFGIFGLFDVATPSGILKHDESFADTLGFWGVGSGPYIVLPFLGPSSLRDAPALIVDFNIHPASLLSSTTEIIVLATVKAIDTRSNLLETTALRDEMALDPYIFTREAYSQYRQNRIYDGEPPKELFEGFEDFEE
jgi:phospholipid-binding lipoprotein MlaA